MYTNGITTDPNKRPSAMINLEKQKFYSITEMVERAYFKRLQSLSEGLSYLFKSYIS